MGTFCEMRRSDGAIAQIENNEHDPDPTLYNGVSKQGEGKGERTQRMFKKTTSTGIDYLTAPMAEDELRYVADHDEFGRVSGVVNVYLDEVAETDFEGFLDLLTERLCETGLLADICYSVVGTDQDDGSILVKVDGEWDD